METVVEIKLTIKVPTPKVDLVTRKLVELVTEFEVFDGGKLEQGNVTVDIK